MRGQRINRKLAVDPVDPVEAELVQLIFRLSLEGDDGSGAMGIKAMTSAPCCVGQRMRNHVGPSEQALPEQALPG